MAEEPTSLAVSWSDELQFQNELRRTLLTNPPSPHTARLLADVDFQRVALGSALPDRAREVDEAVCEAASAGAAGVLGRATSTGVVSLQAGDRALRLPTGTDTPGPAIWLHAAACALVARDADALDVLCEPAHIAASQLPEHLADAFWPFFCAAVAAVIRRPDDASGWIDQAEALLAPNRISRGDPGVIRAEVAPLVPLLRALSSPDGDFAGALQSALEAHRRYFGGSGEPIDPNHLLPLAALGLAALAADRGRSFDPGGLPERLVRGAFERHPTGLALEYPPRRLERLDDATAFLDLEGFPRDRRQHVVVQRGAATIAKYEVRDGPGVPFARLEFVLADGTQSPDVPLALDPGERILLADAYADRAGAATAAGDARAARAWLTQAVEQIDAVVAGIPSGANAVADEAFSSARGQRLRTAEPGRFDRDRLLAYRDALARRVPGSGDAALAESSTPEDRARRAALAAAEVLKQALTPLLVVLAKDHSGAVRETLRPRPDDYDKVFIGPAAEAARIASEDLWRDGLRMELPTGSQSDIRVFVAPAGMLGEPNPLSRHFPGGYRPIARWLNPHRVWACWKYVEPGASSGLAYNGLVWCDDHWSWFPKPYRMLQRLASLAPGRG